MTDTRIFDTIEYYGGFHLKTWNDAHKTTR